MVIGLSNFYLDYNLFLRHILTFIWLCAPLPVSFSWQTSILFRMPSKLLILVSCTTFVSPWKQDQNHQLFLICIKLILILLKALLRSFFSRKKFPSYCRLSFFPFHLTVAPSSLRRFPWWWFLGLNWNEPKPQAYTLNQSVSLMGKRSKAAQLLHRLAGKVAARIVEVCVREIWLHCVPKAGTGRLSFTALSFDVAQQMTCTFSFCSASADL